LILQSYIYREIFRWTFAIIVVLLAAYGGKLFVTYLADVAAGALASGLIYKLFAFTLMDTLTVLLPLSLYFAVLIALSRMLRDKELTAMLASGLGPVFILTTVLRFALIFALGVGVVAFYVGPWAEAENLKLRAQAVLEADITGIAPGRFKEFSKGNGVVYVDQVSSDGRVMRDVFLQVRQRDKLGVLTANQAHLETDPGSGGRFVIFEKGRRYDGTPGRLDYKVTDYKRYAVLLERAGSIGMEVDVGAVPTSVLWHSDQSSYVAELQSRASKVLACILLPLLAVLLTRMTFGHRQYLVFITAILIYFLYTNLLEISSALLLRGEIPAYIGLWWTHGALIAVIAIMFYFPALQRWWKSGGWQRGSASKV